MMCLIGCQRGEGVEHYERSWKATREVENQRDLSCVSTEDLHHLNCAILKLMLNFSLVQVKRDRTMETDRVPAKIGRGSGTKCASSPGKDPAERGRERGTASTSRIAFKVSFYFRIGNISN